MRLKRFSSAQYAGVKGISAEFDGGVNVLLGENESGKSTLIGALLSVLTRPARLDGRSDKAFIEREFPENGASTIDASLLFEQDGREYEITKIWDKRNADSSSRLVFPDKTVYRGDEADERLSSLLKLSPNLLRNLVFVRQSAEEEILAWCYGFFSDEFRKGDDKGIAEARKRIAEAFSAAGGINEDKLINLLQTEINEVGGHWDISRGAPENGRGLNNRWTKGVGSLLRAYYAREEVRAKLRDAQETDERLAAAQKEFAALSQELSEGKAKMQEMQSLVAAARSCENTESLRNECLMKLKKAESAEREWPRCARETERAKALAAMKLAAENNAERARLLAGAERLKRLDAEIAALSLLLEPILGIRDDVDAARRLSGSAQSAQDALSSVKLHLSARIEDGCSAVLTEDNGDTELTGNAEADVSGALRLSVPGVMSLSVTRQGFDAAAAQKKRDEALCALRQLYEKYGVSDIEGLRALEKRFSEISAELAEKRMSLRSFSAEGSAEELTQRAEALPETQMVSPTVDGDIAALLCKERFSTIGEYIAKCETYLNFYASEYESGEKLAFFLEKTRSELAEYDGRLAKLSGNGAMSCSELALAIQRLDGENAAREQKRDALSQSLGRLSALAGGDTAELAQDMEKTENEFERIKQRYEDLLTIKRDFEELRQDSSARFDAFNRLFAENLSVMTDGEISFEQGGGLSLSCASGRITMPFLLSKGTRRTLILAFRLAVLSCFFPSGGGIAVMDDELLDMDGERRAMASKLINRFAENNQVIFATCDSAIANLLGGNIIAFKKQRFRQP
ncbi:MAG: AAA family ATPase [Eubacteriales bacterium]|nr:AAA family ATPase [Eubacteriales bacterium]MDD3883072.1 AAA family ATPase [Eubacteriales bacterium]MDD4513623.1 AAA family ATPase [Eubacteriales bacterium]